MLKPIKSDESIAVVIATPGRPDLESDRPDLLSITLTSLLYQTYTNFQICIVYDGLSPVEPRKGSRRWCSHVIQHHRRFYKRKVTVMKNETKGQVQAVMTAIKKLEPKIELISILHDDFIYDRDYHEILHHQFVRFPNLGVCGGLSLSILHDGSPRRWIGGGCNVYTDDGRFLHEKGGNLWEPYYKEGKEGHVFDACWIRGGYMFRRSVMKAHGWNGMPWPVMTDQGFREEVFPPLAAFKGGYRVLFVPQAKAWHFWARHRKTRPRGSKAWSDAMKNERLLHEEWMKWKRSRRS